MPNVSLADEVRAPRRRKTALDKLLAQLSAEDANDLTALLKDDSVSLDRLHEALVRRGHRIGRTTLYHERLRLQQ